MFNLRLYDLFLLADIHPCEWLSPHHFAREPWSRSPNNSPNVSRPYHLHWSLLSSRLMEVLRYNALLKCSFYPCIALDILVSSWFHNVALELVQ